MFFSSSSIGMFFTGIPLRSSSSYVLPRKRRFSCSLVMGDRFPRIEDDNLMIQVGI